MRLKNSARNFMKKTCSIMDCNMEQTRNEKRYYLTFSVDGNLYGIETTSILGIVQSDTVIPFPHTPPEILGVMKLRGTLCTVIDLRRQLHGKSKMLEWPLLLISLLYRGHRLCASVDAVLSVVEIDDTMMQPLDSSHMQAKQCVLAYANIGGKIVYLLSLDKILEDILHP